MHERSQYTFQMETIQIRKIRKQIYIWKRNFLFCLINLNKSWKRRFHRNEHFFSISFHTQGKKNLLRSFPKAYMEFQKNLKNNIDQLKIFKSKDMATFSSHVKLLLFLSRIILFGKTFLLWSFKIGRNLLEFKNEPNRTCDISITKTFGYK